ncbi:imm11 family protein [Filimonas effusa]|uniref:Uncharacterized protein n=1 Tax=Filimonas effusa TaxID=2508721 RepID=A0A4Q1D757_9BACT|nr:DUF1629 domain-containing protein [Filimonas effusa]RXK83763.1 hypothetical protein ESB13_16950 [Filimonas effusa]
MNYFLEITSLPDYPVKFGKNNPDIDNDIDLGKFINPSVLTEPLHYADANNSDLPWDTILQYDAMRSVSGGIIVSTRLKNLIDLQFPHQVQLLECDIAYRGHIATGFYVMNVYTKLPCYDLERSVYEKSAVDQSFDFEKIALIDGILEEYEIEYHIVRSSFDNRIVVSEAFKTVMEEYNINALEFSPSFVAEW